MNDRWLLCPYGQPGDRLWVRESFYVDHAELLGALGSDVPDVLRLADGRVDADYLYYRADGDCCQQIPECECADIGKPQWRPSIFMPRWASRLVLELTEVRVERLQDISDADAEAEGVARCRIRDVAFNIRPGGDHRAVLGTLWNEFNAKRGFGWDVNPWVWVLCFRRVGR